MANQDALNEIMHDLLSGYSFGTDRTWNYYENKPLRYPYFDAVLYLTQHGSIGWHNFGSSANRCTFRDLEWIITTIFKTTPADFLRGYIRNDKSKYA